MHHHTSHHDPHQRSGPPIGLNDQYELGYAGEAGAIAWYEELGYQLLAHRARVKAGEIDAVLRAPDGTIVFLEVKTRRGTAFGAAESVTPRKLATMRRCAGQWLSQHHLPEARWARFDVVEAVFDGTQLHFHCFEGVEDGAC
ncbi:YraN family protein [Corynebacterium hadale]|uniref:YraN family protein n=1 Tax=Corynebacterium hadale TaxID=2026255 RepID=UPI000BAA44BE|nr:YraN family protein [Corynebacterium hadale]PAT13411.1 YraN family protein [Corynebacterium hadale]